MQNKHRNPIINAIGTTIGVLITLALLFIIGMLITSAIKGITFLEVWQIIADFFTNLGNKADASIEPLAVAFNKISDCVEILRA